MSKYASVGKTNNAITLLEQHLGKHDAHVAGIAHTRWATHGARTDENAHPHLDQSGRIAVVHNGVIENSNELKKELQTQHGIHFRSETDTEVIAQLLGVYVNQGMSLLEAVKKTQDRLEGTWGLAILDKEHPDQILAVKNGSPLLVGIGEGKMFIASESAAFSRYTKEFIDLEDKEVAVLTAKGHSLDRSRIEHAPQEHIQISPAPWPHWTIKEIMEQPAAISRALNYGGRILDESSTMLGGLDANRAVLSGVQHLVIAACGTSFYAGIAGAQYMRHLNAFKTVQVLDAAELTEEDMPKENGGLLVISQSGETKDVYTAMALAQQRDIPCFSVVNAVGSQIARHSACGVYLNAGREHAVASTKAFTCQVTVLALVAIWFSQVNAPQDKQKRRVMIEALHRLPTNVGMTLQSMRETIKKIAHKLFTMGPGGKIVEHMFILGKGAAHPVALEGSLKIKEISYIHAEGYPGGALKHGPYALIEKGTPIVLIVLNDKHAAKMKTVAEEVRARGAYTIVITNNAQMFEHELEASKGADFDLIKIPSNGPMTNLLSVLPFQLLAYELSVMRKENPDRPRNLAKAVTVD